MTLLFLSQLTTTTINSTISISKNCEYFWIFCTSNWKIITAVVQSPLSQHIARYVFQTIFKCHVSGLCTASVQANIHHFQQKAGFNTHRSIQRQVQANQCRRTKANGKTSKCPSLKGCKKQKKPKQTSHLKNCSMTGLYEIVHNTATNISNNLSFFIFRTIIIA